MGDVSDNQGLSPIAFEVIAKIINFVGTLAMIMKRKNLKIPYNFSHHGFTLRFYMNSKFSIHVVSIIYKTITQKWAYGKLVR